MINHLAFSAHHCVRKSYKIELFAGSTFIFTRASENVPARAEYEVLEVVRHPHALDSDDEFHVNDIGEFCLTQNMNLKFSSLAGKSNNT